MEFTKENVEISWNILKKENRPEKIQQAEQYLLAFLVNIFVYYFLPLELQFFFSNLSSTFSNKQPRLQICSIFSPLQ